jgi:acid phosphatase family membrane protein YuiD
MVYATISALASSKLLWSVGLAWFLAQALKVVTYYVQYRQVRMHRLVEPGGMPSSHAALVIALLVGVGMREGVSSTIFIVTLVFALATIYEAIGVRRAAGEQAEIINRLAEYIYRESPEVAPPGREYRLKETLGHNPLEVAVGSLVGLVVSIALI